MPNFTDLLKAREDVETASARLRALEATGLDLIARGYQYPVGGSRGVGATCVPVLQRRSRPEDPEAGVTAIPSRERDAFRVDWSRLPFLKPVRV